MTGFSEFLRTHQLLLTKRIKLGILEKLYNYLLATQGKNMAAPETIETGITISDWLMMAAVIIGPILAVHIQKILDSWNDDKRRMIKVFKDLMTTRAAALSYQHVSSLNMVGLEFKGRKYSKVINAWKVYIDHLNSFPNEDESLAKIWGEKQNDLLSDLLYEMGASLGFDFDKVHIKKAGYIPKAYADREQEEDFIRKSLVGMFLGKKSLPMSLESFPYDSEAIERQKELQELIKEHYEGKRVVKVKIENEKSG